MKTSFPDFENILEAICRGSAIEEILQRSLDQACALVKAHHGSLMRVDRDEDGCFLTILATVGSDWTPEKKAARLRLGEGVTGTVARSGEAYLCPDTGRDTYYVALFPEIRSEVAVPVILQGTTWAVINMDAEEPAAFGPAEVEVLSAFAELVSFAIQAAIARDKTGVSDLETLLRQMGPGTAPWER
jgi:GAF domain-containing protein